MTKMTENVDAETAVKTVVGRLLDKDAIDDIRVTWAEDQIGEPALFVSVRLTKGHKRPSGAQTIELLTAMKAALLDIDDERFPYLSYSAPGDELAEDTRESA
jgi:hypothetical protein